MSLDQVELEQLLDVAAQRLSKQYNMPPEEVKKTLRAVFSSRDRLDRLIEKINKLKNMKPVLDSMPEGIKDMYYQLVLREILSSSEAEDFDKLLRYMLLRDLREGRGNADGSNIMEVIRGIEARLNELYKTVQEIVKAQQDKTIEELSKKIDTLFEEVKKLKEQQPQQQSSVPDYIKKLMEDIEALKKEVSELKNQPSLASRIEQTFKEVETIKSTLEKYGLLSSGSPGSQVQLNPEKLAEELKKYGYEVRKLTPEDISRILEEERKRIREQLENELQIEKVRIDSIKELIKAGIDSVVKPIMDVVAQSMREAFMQNLRLRLAQQYMQVQQQVQRPVQIQVNPATSVQQPSIKASVEGGKSVAVEPQGGSEKSG
jgi:hypothetical protein